MENKRMNDSLASLLMKNIDLILEAFNVDEKGNLVESNKKKVAEADEIFHNYFVKRMNHTFRQINEADPILTDPMNMHPQGTMHGMHGMGMPHDIGMGNDGMDDMAGIGGDEGLGDDQMGDMAMDDMHMQGGMDHQMGQPHQMGRGMGGGMAGGMPPNGMPMESQEGGDYHWVFDENTDLEIDSLFNLTEEDDEEQEDECIEEEDDQLNEFMGGGADFLPDSDMDHQGGHNDFGGDMDGATGGMGDDMGGNDMGMSGGDMGGEMVSIHGTMDNGGDFNFEFDKDALDFDGAGDDQMGGEMGGPDMSSMGDMGGHEGGDDQSGPGDEEDENNFREAAGGFHNGKPGKGKRGPKTARMAVVPADPATKKTAPFPSPMGKGNK